MQQGLGKEFKDSELLDAGTWIAGQFQIIDLIGVGGMGSVYKCMDRMTNRMVAAKVLRRDLAVNSKAVQRFQREAQAIASLEHHNIVKLYNFQSDGQAPILIMEYVEGMPLSKVLENQGTLKLPRALDIAIQICDALNYAHNAGIIHRDLKPSNIIIKQNSDGSETAKLVDFGIAKINDAHNSMTATGEIFGSPGYMSPEQCTGQIVSESADQYALGCVLFECLTGSRPFISDTPIAVVMQHINQLPPTLKEASLGNQFPADIEATVQRLLGKDPARRFPSMLAVQDALSGKRVEAAPLISKPGRTADKPQAISYALLGAGATLLIVASIAVGWFLFHEDKASVANQPNQPNQINKLALSAQTDQTSLTNQSNHDPIEHLSLTTGNLSPPRDTELSQRLYQEHLWRHRTDTAIQRPDDRYPRRGSLSPEAIKTISDMEAVRSVDLSSFCDTALLANLRSNTLLELNLALTDVDDATVEHFSTNLPNLQRLRLGGSKKLKAFSLKSKSLRSLDLSGTDINDTTLKSLRTPKLYDLSLANCKQLTDSGFASLANLASLRQLNIDETRVSDAGIGRLASAPQLESLELGMYSNLTDGCLIGISKLSHLTHLNMHGIDPKGKLSRLQNLPNLEWLGLASTTLTDKDLLDISHLPQLRKLDLGKARLPNAGFSRLVQNCPQLIVKGSFTEQSESPTEQRVSPN